MNRAIASMSFAIVLITILIGCNSTANRTPASPPNTTSSSSQVQPTQKTPPKEYLVVYSGHHQSQGEKSITAVLSGPVYVGEAKRTSFVSAYGQPATEDRTDDGLVKLVWPRVLYSYQDEKTWSVEQQRTIYPAPRTLTLYFDDSGVLRKIGLLSQEVKPQPQAIICHPPLLCAQAPGSQAVKSKESAQTRTNPGDKALQDRAASAQTSRLPPEQNAKNLELIKSVEALVEKSIRSTNRGVTGFVARRSDDEMGKIVEIVEALLKGGANPNTKSDKGHTPLFIIALDGLSA